MYQCFIKKEAATNQIAAMETGNHACTVPSTRVQSASKNWTSLKSQKSRRYFKVMFGAVLILLLGAICGQA